MGSLRPTHQSAPAIHSGGLKSVTRLADYRNFPDLARMFRSFCYVRRTDSLNFRLPVLDGGEAHVHLVPPSAQQLAVADWARERSQGLHIYLASSSPG